MYLHKYKDGSREFYLVTKTRSKPGSIINLEPKDWQGSSSGAGVSQTLSYLKDLKFSKEEVPEEEKTEKKAKSKVTDFMREQANKLDKLWQERQKKTPIPSAE